MKYVNPALIALNVLLLAVVGYFVFAQSPKKIYYVDSNKLLKEYVEMKDARKELEEKTKVWKSNVDTLTVQVEKQIEQYEKTSSRMSSKEQALSRELINTRQRELMQYQQAIQSQAGEEEQKIMGKVLNNVNTYLAEYGKKKGCSYLLLAANGNMAYGEESLNLTDEVLKELNNTYVSASKAK